MFAVEDLRSDEKIFTLDSPLTDDCLDSLPKRNLIIVQTSCIDMPAMPELKPLSQELSEQLLILQPVGAEANERHDLLVG